MQYKIGYIYLQIIRCLIIHSPLSQLASFKTYSRKKLEISCEVLARCPGPQGRTQLRSTTNE